MEPRINYHKAGAGAYQAMAGLERFVRNCGLEHKLLELVKTRASQINGCAYCIDMHTKDARAHGETEQRLYALSAWRDTPASVGDRIGRSSRSVTAPISRRPVTCNSRRAS